MRSSFVFAILLTAVCATTSLAQTADLSVNLSPHPESVRVGDIETQDITVSNHGPDAAWNIVLTFYGAYTVAIEGITTAYGAIDCRHTERDGVCSILWIPPSGAVTVTLVTRAVSGSGDVAYYPFNASVTSPARDPNPANNKGSSLISTWYPFSIRFKTNQTTVPVGGLLRYSIIIENGGPSNEGLLHIEHQPPAGFLVSSSAKPSATRPGVLTYEVTVGPYETVEIPVLLWANRPGVYDSWAGLPPGIIWYGDQARFTVLPPPRRRVSGR